MQYGCVVSANHWGRRPRDWAELAEPSNHRLFQTVLDRMGIGQGTELLDIGCGSGYASRLAAERGARVTGVDITLELLETARERVPSSDLQVADMQRLPFPDGRVDAAVGFNVFPFAEDPELAVREAARVTRAGASWRPPRSRSLTATRATR